VTPPNSTANKSSEMVPRIAGLLRMKRTPAKMLSVLASLATTCGRGWMKPVRIIPKIQNSSMIA
jgi:hypothetical protein